jgi:hypothetical protein
MLASNKKFLYCLPWAGFNDTLCQIERAWRYADEYKRVLIVDTNYSSLDRQLAHYFCTRRNEKVLLEPTDNMLNYINTLTCFPPCLTSCVNKKGVFASGKRIIDPDTKVALSFDFTDNYFEDVLVHQDFGGGALGIYCLSRLKLQKWLSEKILDTLSPLGDDYYAIHIRNTDLKTNYLPFFKKIFPEVAGKKLAICSDDFTCRETAKIFFNQSDVVTITQLPNTHGKPLHKKKISHYDRDVAMLTDLFCLACAKKLFIAKPVNASDGISGFSLLAYMLHKNKTIRAGLFSSTF